MRERGGRGTTDSTAASGIPFCPASWKQLENGCGMLGDRERQGERAGKKKVLAERANGEREREREKRAARPKLMPSKFSLILLYLAKEGRRGKPSALAPLLLLFYPLRETDRPMEVQENILKLFLHPPSSQFQSPFLPPSLPCLASFTFPIFFSQLPPTFLQKTGEKQKSLP